MSAKIYNKLNDEQLLAVNAPLSKHILILAGAGCGKTTVLTHRIAYCIESGIDQKNLLALTFTRKAADEMLERVKKLGIIDSCKSAPIITTFHGFALKVLSEKVGGISNFERIGFPRDGLVLDDTTRMQMLAAISMVSERRALQIDLPVLDSLIAKYEVFPQSLQCTNNELISYVKLVSARLNDKKRTDGYWDFSDLLNGLIDLFKKCPEIQSFYNNRFSSILVDEFQDTNPVQIEILKLLLCDNNRVYAVGDDDQAIYGFRGADIRPTLEFKSCFHGADIYKLQINYRSVKPVLALANRIFKNKEAQYKKVLISGRYAKGKYDKPGIIKCLDQKKMIEWISQKSIALSAAHHIALRDMVILCRTNQSVDTMINEIKENAPQCEEIQVMTIHRSKGLEFPVVFLTDLEDSIFPSYQQPNRNKIRSYGDLIKVLLKGQKKINCDWDEEKRLFYVAVTRAEKFLYCCYVQNKKVYGRIRKFEKSRFLTFAK
jgi:superfamily I DNA/RNA helicase